MAKSNILYLAVLPLIPFGDFILEQEPTREYLTLLPNAAFATEFFPDEVDGYIQSFLNKVPWLTGGRVRGYECFKEPTLFSGRVRVKVVQYVE